MAAMAPVPTDEEALQEYVEEFEVRWRTLRECAPLTDAEAAALMPLFEASEDETLFGLLWAVLHAVETAPYVDWQPPTPGDDGTWRGLLRARWDRYLADST